MNSQIKVLIGNRKLYFQVLLFMVLVSMFSILVFGWSFGSIPLNAYHPLWLNVYFINYTFMGNGLFAISLAAVYRFRFKTKKEGMALLYAFLFSAAIVQLLKNLGNFSHPFFFIEQGQYLFVRDRALDQAGFISGHTTTAFALATVLMLLSKRGFWQLPLLAAAVLLGYSRIYLAQHSLADVIISAVLGTVAGVIAVHFVCDKAKNFAAFRNVFRVRYKEPMSPNENSLPLAH